MNYNQAFNHLLLTHRGFKERPFNKRKNAKYGIVKEQLPDLEVENIDLETAKLFYRRLWDTAQCEKLPSSIRGLHFEAVLTLGIASANKVLQKAIASITPNGIMDTKTLMYAVLVTQDEYLLEYWSHLGKQVLKNPLRSYKAINAFVRSYRVRNWH